MSRHARLGFVVVSLLTLTATLALRLGTDVSTAAVSSTLHASVGPGYTISLTYDDGTSVVDPPPGTYRVLVEDDSDEHNFHFYGPGVDLLTSVESSGSATWTVTLRNNATYSFQCDPHADSMYGKFDVGTPVDDRPSSSGGGGTGGSGGGGGKSGATTAPKATGRVLATLTARVDARGKLLLTLKGKPVKTLGAGSYKIVVSDSAKKDDFTLRRVGGPATALTGVAYVGSRTITTDLKPGQWKVYSSPREASSAVFFRVTKS
jgi:hypothetical protein